MSTPERVLWTLAVLIFMALAISALSPAKTQQRTLCDDREKVIVQLVHKHGETPLWQGLTPGGRTTMELWGASDGGWTIIEIYPGIGGKSDQACARSAGDMWTTIIWPPAWGM